MGATFQPFHLVEAESLRDIVRCMPAGRVAEALSGLAYRGIRCTASLIIARSKISILKQHTSVPWESSSANI